MKLFLMKKKRKWPCCMFKANFGKAYDNVKWNFLFYMLKRLGFYWKWISWIKGSLHSSTMSVLVNGGPTGGFNI